MRHSSVLAVHARPIPDELSSNDEDDVAIEVCIRRKKLSEAWSIMQACDGDLWTDVCDLYSMVVAVEENPSKFEGVTYVLKEVAEARALMRNAELVYAVETIEAYNQDEWKQEKSPSCVRRGSLMVVHEEEHRHAETQLEARVRHLEHADAWQKMTSCNKDAWAAACNFHEEQNKAEVAKREKLDAACWVMQDFDSKEWSSQKVLPKAMRHAATLTVHSPKPLESERNDEAYKTHRERLLQAWQTMKGVDQKEWLSACKAHEEFVMKGFPKRAAPKRNGVGGMAA